MAAAAPVALQSAIPATSTSGSHRFGPRVDPDEACFKAHRKYAESDKEANRTFSGPDAEPCVTTSPCFAAGSVGTVVGGLPGLGWQ